MTAPTRPFTGSLPGARSTDNSVPPAAPPENSSVVTDATVAPDAPVPESVEGAMDLDQGRPWTSS